MLVRKINSELSLACGGFPFRQHGILTTQRALAETNRPLERHMPQKRILSVGYNPTLLQFRNAVLLPKFGL